jgi:hypothetical protein
MAGRLLDRLPIESLRQVCRRLPCDSALNFTLVCLSIYHACQDWTVWRAVVTQALPEAVHLDTPNTGWKQYAIAAAKATTSDGQWKTEDISSWLPQMVALHHPSVTQGDVTSLTRLWGTTMGQFCSTNLSEQEATRLLSSVEQHDAKTWLSAQAASFSLTVRYLSIPTPIERPRDQPLCIPWLPTDDPAQDMNLASEEQAQCVVI